MTSTKGAGLSGIIAALVLHFTGTSTRWAQLLIGLAGFVFYLVDHILSGSSGITSIRKDLEKALEAVLRFLNVPSSSPPSPAPAPTVTAPPPAPAQVGSVQ